MMKAQLFRTTGGPQVLEQAELPVPEPQPGTVVVRNHAAGVNFVDTMFRAGRLPPHLLPPLPHVPGQEGAGIVVALGEGVSNVAIGARVLWVDSPHRVDGYAQFTSVRATNVASIANHVSFAMAAAVPLTYATARNQIRNYYGRAVPGDWALVRTAAGAAGSAMMATALAEGMRVIAVTSTNKLDFCLSQGATAVIDYKSENVPARVHELTNGRGVSLALNPVGGASLADDFAVLAPCGHLILFGLLDGFPHVDLFALWKQKIGDGLTMSIPSIDQYMNTYPEKFSSLLAGIANDLNQGIIKPAISSMYPLEEAIKAHQHLESGDSIGKIVLTVG